MESLKLPPSGSPFTMLGQPNVLSGESWLEYRAKVLEEYPDYYKAKPKKKKTQSSKPSSLVRRDGELRSKRGTFTPNVRRVTMAAVEARYHAWYADASEENERLFAEDLYCLLQRRMFADTTQDGKKLWEHQRYEEFFHDFFGYFFELLKTKRSKGEELVKFEHYLNRAWRMRKLNAFVERAEYDRLHPRSTFKPEEDRDEEYATTFSLDDKRDYKAWAVQQNSFISNPESAGQVLQTIETREEVFARREAKLPTLDPALADLVGFKMAGLTDTEIGQRLGGLSRQAVGRLKDKARIALAQGAA